MKDIERDIYNILDRTIGDQLVSNINEVDENENLIFLGLDSLGFVRLVVELESNYNLYIDEENLDIENFNTIKKIKKFVIENIED